MQGVRDGLPSEQGFQKPVSAIKGLDRTANSSRNTAWTPRRTLVRHAFPGRVEDDVLVRGHGRYVADAPEPNQAYAFFVRSPHAFARIVGIEAAGAKSMPGVIAVLTAADMDGIGNIARHPPLPGRNGSKLVVTNRPALAKDRVLHIGEAVAVVVAERAAAAQDAAEFVHVEYEALTPVTDARDALKDGAPQIWPEAREQSRGRLARPGCRSRRQCRRGRANLCLGQICRARQRNESAALRRLDGAARRDRELRRGKATAYTLRTCSQSAGTMRDNVVAIMNWPKEKLRVITEDVGGAFGLKTSAYPEYIALLAAAKTLNRPVHWMSGRSEAFLSDNQARDIYSEVELALDDKGKFLALRIRSVGNMGAYLGAIGAAIPTLSFTRCLPGMYDIPKIDVAVKCAYTNTLPTAPYRGAGRPEASYALERVVDEAARMTGIDPRQTAAAQPDQEIASYKTQVGTVIDSGDFAPILDEALKLAGYDNFKGRSREAQKRGKYRGLGICCMLEHSGGSPTESALLEFPGNGTLQLRLNVQNTGQGHATVFAELIGERLGISPNKIPHRHGNSSNELPGYASVGSRSGMTVSHSVVKAIDAILAKGKPIAAAMLETGEGDITYRNGSFEVVGTDRRVTLFEVADRAAALKKRGEIAEDLDTKQVTDTPQTFPNGVHIAEVEIDPATGHLQLAAYAAVDDCGHALDHTIVIGQLHGSLASGIGQALMERTVYDSNSGQLVTGSFMDYAMPRAEDMPPLRDGMHNVPATTNPLGVKGVGEAGTTAAIAAVMNAVADAIPNGAGVHLEMPATAQKIWEACQRAKG